MGRARYVPRRLLVIEPEPFATAEEAWLWYAQCQMARLAGGRLRADMATVPRPCDPDDIHREVMRLRRRGVLLVAHLRVLAEWGSRLTAGTLAAPGPEEQESLWREALDRLETSLKSKGIVA